MGVSEPIRIIDKPSLVDLDHCVHCGLCLNACPTYRELGLEMDSPRGRVYQMVKVAEGELEIGPSYVEHVELCLACRACESACPSGVKYGRLIEAARCEIETHVERPFGERLMRSFVFGRLLESRFLLRVFGFGLYLYQKSGMQALNWADMNVERLELKLWGVTFISYWFARDAIWSERMDPFQIMSIEQMYML